MLRYLITFYRPGFVIENLLKDIFWITDATNNITGIYRLAIAREIQKTRLDDRDTYGGHTFEFAFEVKNIYFHFKSRI